MTEKEICHLLNIVDSANKVEVLHENGSIKIKPKEWIDKKNWREINDILRIYDFKWFGDGKESCWVKKEIYS